jgi:hypothetical protein
MWEKGGHSRIVIFELQSEVRDLSFTNRLSHIDEGFRLFCCLPITSSVPILRFHSDHLFIYGLFLYADGSSHFILR